MSEMDNTYAERFPDPEVGRESSKIYATAIDDSTAAATVTALSTDTIATDEFLDVMADKLEGDADYLDAVAVANLAALVADTEYLGFIADELEGDTNFLAAVAQAVLAASAAANPSVDDASFTFGAEVADEIDATIQLLDADSANFAQRTMVSVWWCSDADGAVPAGATGIGGITTEGTSGGVLETISTGMSYQCVTDDTGKLSLTLADDDATADLTSYLGVMLPNGKYVVSSAIVFNPS
jgi:hypothetical protein